jgi:hypothetical protein
MEDLDKTPAALDRCCQPTVYRRLGESRRPQHCWATATASTSTTSHQLKGASASQCQTQLKGDSVSQDQLEGGSACQNQLKRIGKKDRKEGRLVVLSGVYKYLLVPLNDKIVKQLLPQSTHTCLPCATYSIDARPSPAIYSPAS